jgi:histidinol dehydrogenase
MVTPPGKNGKVNPLVLAAAKEVGVSEVYKIGGAQAIAALAYGTETIRPVLKIVGPGNLYVTLAKKRVIGTCGIDKLAGPSDVLIIADSTANPVFIAADMLAQAEHDRLACAILVTTSDALAHQVNKELAKQCQGLARREIAEASLGAYGRIFIVESIDAMISTANAIAPEHCEIMVEPDQEDDVADQITCAGAIFIGPYSPVALGDYLAGPNHVLPTGGTASFDSPLSVMDFVKATSLIRFSKASLKAVSSDIEKLAMLEGLQGHALSVVARG